MEMHARRPEKNLQDLDEAQKTFHEGFSFYSRITAKEMDEVIKPIVDTAKKIGQEVCKLDDIDNKKGFMLAITKNTPDFPTVFVEIGHTWAQDCDFGRDGKRKKYIEFAGKKAEVIKKNNGFIASGQNISFETSKRIKSSNGLDIPQGALLFGEWIISVSAFKNAEIDTATTISIAVGAGLISLEDAKKLALDKRINCRAFIEKIDQICVEPIYH
jgi:hypothetical protein